MYGVPGMWIPCQWIVVASEKRLFTTKISIVSFSAQRSVGPGYVPFTRYLALRTASSSLNGLFLSFSCSHGNLPSMSAVGRR